MVLKSRIECVEHLMKLSKQAQPTEQWKKGRAVPVHTYIYTHLRMMEHNLLKG